mgnify:CR=1 FL=1
MTSENSVGNKKVSSWGQEYNSIFTRTSNGTYQIADEYFMPVVRNVPIFPDKDLKPGDSWQAEGHEAHDLRQTFILQHLTKFLLQHITLIKVK